MDSPATDAEILAIALADWTFERALAAGEVLPAEAQAYRAARAERIAQLDSQRGTADVTYEQFVIALQNGASCEVLTELKNRMDPKDPLRDAAISDLRSVGCYSTASIRRAPDAQG